MALRLLLVALVTSLGMDPPSHQELTRWVQSGGAWWTDQVSEWNETFVALEGEEEVVEETAEAVAIPVTAPSTTPLATELADEIFAAIADDMAANFARDEAELLAAQTHQREAEAEAEALAVQLAQSARESEAEALAVQLAQSARESEAVSAQLCSVVATAPTFEPCWVPDDLFPGEAYALNRAAEGLESAAAVAAEPAEPVTPVDAPQSERRLAAALRITGDALHAWATLLESPGSVQRHH